MKLPNFKGVFMKQTKEVKETVKQTVVNKVNELDRTKPFGQVMGDPVIRFEQNGKNFDYSGKEVK